MNPPDPQAAELVETTTGGQLELFRGVIERFQAEGYVGRGRPLTFPEFSQIRSLEELVIIDCQETSPDLGVYVASSGERTDLIPVVVEGQLDLRETTMLLEEGRWKVSDVQAATDVQCRTPPTPTTLRIAGG